MTISCCVSAAFAQKNAEKIVKSVSKVPAVKGTEIVHPSSLGMGKLVFPTVSLERGLLSNLEVAVRQPVEARAKLPPHKLVTGPQASLPAHFAPKEHFFVDYLLDNQWKWPTWQEGAEARNALADIRHTMAIKNPSLEQLAMQQGLIRYRAAQGGMEELVPAVQNYLLQWDTLPAERPLDAEEPFLGFADKAQLGEDFHFALAARQVPMEHNPFVRLSGLEELADRYAVFQALRRVSPTSAGIPVFAKDGTVQIKAWTRDEYQTRQEAWVTQHPTEYVLADYRIDLFGDKLPELFEVLSPTEQQAILFSSPGLPSVDRERIASLRAGAIAAWEQQAGRAASSCLNATELDYTQLLSQPIAASYRFTFVASWGENVPFLSLSYEQQVEELIWVWKEQGISPVEALPHLTGRQL